MDASGDLPSWAVDWSKSRVTTSLAYRTSAVSCYNAGPPSVVSCSLSLHQAGVTLSLKAKVFDAIVHLSQILDSADLEAGVSDDKNAALRTCIAHATTITVQCSIQQPLEFLGFCKVMTAGKDGSGSRKYADAYTEIFNFLSDAITGEKPTFYGQSYTRKQELPEPYRLTADSFKTRTIGETFEDLKVAFRSALLNRRLCWTKKGYLGLVPRFTRQGDKIIVVPGSSIPFVVRQVGMGSYHFIGECYIDGIMDGQAFNDQGQGLEVIGLV
jgi:hypothetical protein